VRVEMGLKNARNHIEVGCRVAVPLLNGGLIQTDYENPKYAKTELEQSTKQSVNCLRPALREFHVAGNDHPCIAKTHGRLRHRSPALSP